MSKEGVEVRFGAEVEDLMEMGMVYVSKDAEELAVYVFYCRGKRLREVMTLSKSFYEHSLANGFH